MLDWSQLLLPALYSSVAVFILSSLIHTVFKWHAPDYHGMPNEEELRSVIRKSGVQPGQYMIPFCKEGKQDPATVQKFVEGPVVSLVVRPSGAIQMGGFLAKWFVYCFVVSMLAGYVAHFMLPVPAASYGQVFRLVGTVAWLAYAWGGPSDAIWMGKPWGSTLKYMFDGLLYALLTAGCFAWQWPHGAA